MIFMQFDGHVHSPFCPHGTSDSFEAYIEKAISLGLKGMTFTEHAPLPEGFHDPTPDQDSGMKLEHLEPYIKTLQQLKLKYETKLTIKIGLEVDYIEGYERETEEFLSEWGHVLDDAIISVHFLKFADDYFCLDFSPDMFADMVRAAGSLENVYETYYATVKKAILSDLGRYKPKRIGHITLIHKFKQQFVPHRDFSLNIRQLLDLIQQKNYELDYNGAGFSKPLCGEAYPPAWVVNEAVKRGIPLIYGSDAHSVKGLGQGFDRLFLKQKTTFPTLIR